MTTSGEYTDEKEKKIQINRAKKRAVVGEIQAF